MPVLLPLTSERLVRHGLFLVEDGQNMFLWIGRDAVPQLLMDVFDKPSYDQLPLSGKVRRSCTLQRRLSLLNAHPTHRSRFRPSTTPSPSASMRLSSIPERCGEGPTGPTFTSSGRTAI